MIKDPLNPESIKEGNTIYLKEAPQSPVINVDKIEPVKNPDNSILYYKITVKYWVEKKGKIFTDSGNVLMYTKRKPVIYYKNR